MRNPFYRAFRQFSVGTTVLDRSFRQVSGGSGQWVLAGRLKHVGIDAQPIFCGKRLPPGESENAHRRIFSLMNQ
jgi:hypothetical protein